MKTAQIYNPKFLTLILLIGFTFSIPVFTRSQNFSTTGSACHLDTFPSLVFSGRSSKLTSSHKLLLDTIAKQLIVNPSCGAIVNFSSSHSEFHPEIDALIFDRLMLTVKYLLKKQVDSNRVLMVYEYDVPKNTISLKPVSIKMAQLQPVLHSNDSTRPKKSNSGYLQDSDGDGITDQFDLEPNTHTGADVDTHGRAIDTDADGVPDWKDKEKLTQQLCFPVDSNGVGVCPDPACCGYFRFPHHPGLDNLKNKTCNLDTLPSIVFKKGSVALSKTAKLGLDSIIQLLVSHPSCNVKIVSFTPAPAKSSYQSQQLSWDHAYVITDYLQEKGISAKRLIFVFAVEGDANVVALQPTNETGPYINPPPIPVYTKIKNLPLQKIIEECKQLKYY